MQMMVKVAVLALEPGQVEAMVKALLVVADLGQVEVQELVLFFS
jgi:hypothetical protein